MLSLVIAAVLLEASAHGRLKDPPARTTTNVAIQDRPMKEFACRSAKNPDVPATEVVAGEKLTLVMDIAAQHPGDVAVYMSYDHDLPYENLEEMRFFKIANVFDAQDHHLKPVEIELPTWLPGGNAVLRWEWYALHENPNVEFWVQCSDLVVTPSEKELPVEKIPTYQVVSGDNARTLPLEGPRRENDELKKYRKVEYNRDTYKWENPKPDFMTGVECALGFTKNDCKRTAFGTPGHVDVWHKHREDDPDSGFRRPTLPKLSPIAKGAILSVLALFVLYCCAPRFRKQEKERMSGPSTYKELPTLSNTVSESQRFNLDYSTPRCAMTPSSVRRRSIRGPLLLSPRLALSASLSS